MVKTTVRALAVLLLWQLASCAGSEPRYSGDAFSDKTAASSYADAIMAGMARARAMRELRLQSSVLP